MPSGDSDPQPHADEVIVHAPPRLEQADAVHFFAVPPGYVRATLDLANVEWIAPIGIVGLLSLISRSEQDGLGELTIVAPESEAVRDYLSQVGFVDALEQAGVKIAEEFREPPPSAPIRPCLRASYVASEREMERAAERLWAVLDELHAPPQVSTASYEIMAELTNNGWEHGNGCFVVAQTHTGATSGTPGVHLAIADLGPGFRATLSRYHPSSEMEAVVRALEDQVSGTGNAMRGFGLSNVVGAVDAMEGDLSIISGDAWLRRHERVSRRMEGPDCRGVFVTAYLPFHH